MDSILTTRPIDHDEAREAVQRLVNSHFNNPRDTHEHGRMSIPANPDRDDDLVLSAYIKQRRQTSDDLQRVLDAVLYVLGPEALLKVDKHVKAARRARETNDEIDALEHIFSEAGSGLRATHPSGESEPVVTRVCPDPAP